MSSRGHVHLSHLYSRALTRAAGAVLAAVLSSCFFVLLGTEFDGPALASYGPWPRVLSAVFLAASAR